MKQLLKYSSLIALSFAIAAPALGVGIILPSAPPTGSAPGLTGSGVVGIITTGVNYLITVSVVLAIAFFIWGAIKFAAMGDTKEGKAKMTQAAWALLAILGIGLLINTISGLLSRGLNLG